MAKKKGDGIKFGDPRIFFESTTTAPFTGPNGIKHDTGAVVRGAAHISVEGKELSISLPSMAQIVYFQSRKDLSKASAIKSRALKTEHINGYYRLSDEELFYTYLQLCSLGILGLYSSIESMVYELYLIKNNERKITMNGKELTFEEFTRQGFDRKITSIASQLSGKSNIHGTVLMDKANEIKRLRTTIQHWDVERRDDYFTNLPDNHPLKEFPKIDPIKLADDTKEILDHYSLKPQDSK